MSAAALRVQQLSVNYEKTPVLWDLSFEVPPGKLVAVVGPNGAGKSTLLKASIGLIKPLSGQVTFFQKPLRQVRRRVAYVPQRESVDWDFPITLLDLVLMGRYGQRGLLGHTTRADRREVMQDLERVGLDAYAHRQISQLSGGQQQRAFLARALTQRADLYLMDEPFAAIDASSSKIIVEILHQLRDEGKTLIVVHHDLTAIEQYFDWVILLNMCLIGCGSLSSVFTTEMIQKTYGKKHTVLLDEAAKLSQEKSRGFVPS